MTKYILFCAQDANFQTRSMLIPYDKFRECRQRWDQWIQLTTSSITQAPFTVRGKKYIVDKLLIQNITWDEGNGSFDKTPLTDIIHQLRCYADGFNDGYVFESEDELWLSHALGNVASRGFNHIGNYCNFRNTTEYDGVPIEIVDGLLVLESNNGVINLPDVHTVSEMYQKYYRK